jgi:Do/DeqQ family serine protease
LALLVLLAVVGGTTVIVALSIVQTTALRSPFRRVAVVAWPAVVNISADKLVQVRRTAPNELDDFLQREPHSRPLTRHQHVLGSGFIFDRRGYVITNYHVISGYEDIVIQLADGTEYTADSVSLVGVDPWSDLAVLKIETGRRLPVARLGNSDRLAVGDWVAAIGNPFGLSGTVTAGVVSAFNRSGIPMSKGPQFQDFIQTDASINPGNSGGPLVNDRGEVIGVSSAIRSPIRGSVGIGFAIPVNFAREAAEILIREGRIVRGYLGLDTQPIDDRIRAALGLKEVPGVLVSAVAAGGPAARGGVLPGDVIVEFAGQPITDIQQFQSLAAGSEPGQATALAVRRRGRRVNLEIVPAVRTATEPPAPEPAAPRYWLGIKVRAATDFELRRSGTSSGVVVDTVEAGSPAEQAAIQAGDVVIELEGRPVQGMSDYQRLAAQMSRARRPLLFRVLRGRQGVFFAVDPGD